MALSVILNQDYLMSLRKLDVFGRRNLKLIKLCLNFDYHNQ